MEILCNFLWLVSSWTLKKRSTAITSQQHNSLLHFKFYPYPQMSSASMSSKNLLFIIKYKPSQEIPNGHHAVINGSCTQDPSLHGYSYNNSPADIGQGILHQKGKNYCKNQNTRKPAMKKCLVEIVTETSLKESCYQQYQWKF